jgi:hypothetical protein
MRNGFEATGQEGFFNKFLDIVACEMLQEARRRFCECGLLSRKILRTDTGVLLFTWYGDAVNERRYIRSFEIDTLTKRCRAAATLPPTPAHSRSG